METPHIVGYLRRCQEVRFRFQRLRVRVTIVLLLRLYFDIIVPFKASPSRANGPVTAPITQQDVALLAELAQKVQLQLRADETRAHEAQELSELREKLAAMEKEKDRLQIDLDRFQNEAAEQRTHLDTLLLQKERDHDKLKAEKEEIAADLVRAETRIATLAEERDLVETQRDEQAQSLDGLRQQNQALSADLNQLVDAIAGAEGQVAELLVRVEGLEAKNFTLEEDCLAQKKEITSLTRKYSETCSQNEALYSQNLELRRTTQGSGGDKPRASPSTQALSEASHSPSPKKRRRIEAPSN